MCCWLWYWFLEYGDGLGMNVCLLCAGSVGSNGDFLTGVGSGWTWVGCFHWLALFSLTFVAFEGFGGGIGHVLVGGIVAVCSLSEVISSPEMLSRCDCSSSIAVLWCYCEVFWHVWFLCFAFCVTVGRWSCNESGKVLKWCEICVCEWQFITCWTCVTEVEEFLR